MICVNECVFVLAIVNVLRPWFLFQASSLSVKSYATLVRNRTESVAWIDLVPSLCDGSVCS